MSEQTKPVECFVFTHSATGLVLACKRVLRGPDLSLCLPGVGVARILGAESSFSAKPLGQVFSVAGGLRPAPAIRKEELTAITLLADKVSRLLVLKINLELMKAEVKRGFSVRELLRATVRDENLRRYLGFMRSERRVILRRINSFYGAFEKKVAAAPDTAAVTRLFADLAENVQLGVYSATNQERKNLRAG